MTTDTTQTDPFDQQVYDAVMKERTNPQDAPKGFSEGYRWGYCDAAANAARIVAERAETAPTDEALLSIYREAADKFYADGGYQPGDLLRDEPADAMRIAGIRAVRAALQPPPAIPEWVKSWTIVRDGEHGPGYSAYTNHEDDGAYFETWGYDANDPDAALANAIDVGEYNGAAREARS